MKVPLLPCTAAVLAIGYGLFHWISSWGTVTIHAKEKPIAAVLSSVERQSGIRLISNLDPARTLSIQFKRVKVSEALDRLAAETGSRWSTVMLVASDAETLQQGAQGFSASRRPEGWRRVSSGIPRMVDLLFSDPEPHHPLRRPVGLMLPSGLAPEESLSFVSASLSVDVFVPEDFAGGFSPGSYQGKLNQVLQKMGKDNSLQTERFIYLSSWQGAAGGGNRPEPQAATPSVPGAENRGGNFSLNVAWVDQHLQNRTATLHPEDRDSIRSTWNEMRPMLEAVEALPPEARAEAMREVFQNESLQTLMDEMRTSRDLKRSHEARVDRYRRYVERKEAMKQAQ